MKTGKRTRLLTVFVLVAIALAAGFYFFRAPREPRYQGKPVSYWFREYYRPNMEDELNPDHHDEAAVALQKIGTNALPFLVKEAFTKERDSAVRSNLYALMEKFPDSWNLPRFVSRDDIRQRAVSAILEIDPPASVILPFVRKELDETNTPQYTQTIQILSGATNDAEILVPFFAKALHDPDRDTQVYALAGLRDIGAQAKSAVPDLIALLQNPQSSALHRWSAAFELGSIGSDAAPAIPALKEAFNQEAKPDRRFTLSCFLLQIDARQPEPLAFVISCLTNSEAKVGTRLSARWLAQVGPNAKPAIPAMLDALNTTNSEDWTDIALCLKKLGASSEQILPKIREKLNSEHDDIRLDAGRSILEIDPTDEQAQSVLMDLIRNDSQVEREAVETLGKLGTNAGRAIPVILLRLDATNMLNWSSIADALTNIGVPAAAFLPKLDEKLRLNTGRALTNEYLLLLTAYKILELDPADRDAQLFLVSLIKDGSESAPGAAAALADATPVVQEAIPVLRAASKSKSIRLRNAARSALKKIEAKEKVK